MWSALWMLHEHRRELCTYCWTQITYGSFPFYHSHRELLCSENSRVTEGSVGVRNSVSCLLLIYCCPSLYLNTVLICCTGEAVMSRWRVGPAICDARVIPVSVTALAWCVSHIYSHSVFQPCKVDKLLAIPIVLSRDDWTSIIEIHIWKWWWARISFYFSYLFIMFKDCSWYIRPERQGWICSVLILI